MRRWRSLCPYYSQSRNLLLLIERGRVPSAAVSAPWQSSEHGAACGHGTPAIVLGGGGWRPRGGEADTLPGSKRPLKDRWCKSVRVYHTLWSRHSPPAPMLNRSPRHQSWRLKPRLCKKIWNACPRARVVPTSSSACRLPPLTTRPTASENLLASVGFRAREFVELDRW